MNNNQNPKKVSNGKKIAIFFANGLKKSLSVDTDSVIVSRRIKERSVELFFNFKDIVMIFVNAILIVFYYFVGMLIYAKDIPHALSRAAHNNFRLGLEELKKNNLVDARIRLLLSNLFYGKSSTTKYYIAYVYYRQGNYKKSLKYLRQSLQINADNERSIELLKTIEKELEDKKY